MKSTSLVLGIFATFGISGLASAAAPDSATLKGIYDTSRNMAGVIKHCVDKGYLKAGREPAAESEPHAMV